MSLCVCACVCVCPFIINRSLTLSQPHTAACWCDADLASPLKPLKSPKSLIKPLPCPNRQMLFSPLCAICVSSNHTPPCGAVWIWPRCYIPLLQEVISFAPTEKGCRSCSLYTDMYIYIFFFIFVGALPEPDSATVVVMCVCVGWGGSFYFHFRHQSDALLLCHKSSNSIQNMKIRVN